jgi:hypothetical protein
MEVIPRSIVSHLKSRMLMTSMAFFMMAKISPCIFLVLKKMPSASKQFRKEEDSDQFLPRALRNRSGPVNNEKLVALLHF